MARFVSIPFDKMSSGISTLSVDNIIGLAPQEWIEVTGKGGQELKMGTNLHMS